MSDSPKKSPPATRWEIWRRRTRRTVYTLIVIALVFRIILLFVFAPVLAKVAAAYGFTATYDRQDLTLLGGDIGLWGLKITPLIGGPEIFSADYVRGNISTVALLEGRLYVRRAEVDGSQITLERTADGRIPLLEQFVANKSAPPPAAPATAPGPFTLDFTPTLAVEAFRLSHVRAKVMDESVHPAFESTVAMDVRVSNFGIAGQPINYEIDTWSDPALDLLRISGQSVAKGQSLHATATVTMRGLHPRPLAGYLGPLGIRPVGASLTGALYADLTIAPAQTPDVGISLSLALQNIGLWSEEQPAASISNFAITANAVDPRHILLNTVNIDGVRVNVARDAAAGVQFAGFALSPAKSTAPAANPAPTPPSPPAPSKPLPFGLDLREFSISDVDFRFRDSAVFPFNELHLAIPQIVARPDGITGTVQLPGIIREISFTGGRDQTPKSITMKVQAQGVNPIGLKPYLSAGGIESLWQDGKLNTNCSAALRRDTQGDWVVDAACGPITLGEGNDFLTLGRAVLRGAGLDSQSGRIKVASLELAGPELRINRDTSGRVTVANLRWTPSQTAAPTEETSAPSSSIGSMPLPRIEVGEFLWHEPNITFKDDYAQPPSQFTLNDAGLDVKNFRFDLDADGPAEDGSILAWLRWPNPAGQITLKGTTHSLRDLFHADLAVRGGGLRLADLAPYTKTIGFDPTIRNGSLQLDADADVARVQDHTAASLDIRKVSFRDGDTELAGLDSVHVAGVHFDPDGADVATILIDSPRVAAGRDPDGVLKIAGIRLLPMPPVQTDNESFTVPKPVGIGELRVFNASVNWSDKDTPDPVSVILHEGLFLHNVRRDPAAPPATFEIRSTIVGTLDELLVSGSLDPHPDHLHLDAKVIADGVRGGIIAEYLPPGVKWDVNSGEFRVAFEADSPTLPAGGRSVKVNLHDLSWRDGLDGPSILSIPSAKILASRIDPTGGVIAIDQITLDGSKAEAQLDAQGALHAMGLTLGSPSPSSAPRPQRQLAAARPASAPADLTRLIAKPGQTVPHLTVQNLDINLEKISLRNLAQPKAVPLALEHVRLHNPHPIDLGGATLYSTPTELDLTGAITPIVGKFAVVFTATPLQQQPVVTATLSVTGIRGQGITDIAPQLATLLDGSGMTDGRITAAAKVTIDFNRRGPRDFNLMRGFKVDASVRNLEMRDRPDGPVLAGIQAIYVQSIAVRPTAGTVIAREIDVMTPQLFAYRDAGGVHVCGIAIRPGAAPAAKPATPAPSPPARAAADPPAPPPSGEIRLDRLFVSGLNVRLEDRLANPVFVLPLNGLDLEIRDLTTRALYEPKTIRFAALLSSDNVAIPNSSPATTRPLFSQAVATGKISLFPSPDGYIKLSLNGLELAALQGVANEFGAQLRGGLFDADVTLRPRQDASNGGRWLIDTRCRLVLTDLQLSDSPDGKISRGLRLPAPLDTVIVALQDPDGSITVPLSFTIQNGQLNSGDIVAAAVGASGPIIATAVASAPLKLAGGVVGIFGVGGDKHKLPRIETYDIPFPPGSTQLDSDDMTIVRAMLALAHREPDVKFNIRHILGSGDVQLASQRANPDPADALAMIQQLRQRRLELSDQRARLAGLLRGQMAALTDSNTDDTVAQLRQTERQLADIETAGDELYDLLRPGASRQAGRRTRGAAMEIAQQRLDNVENLFRASLTGYADRVRAIAAQYNPGTTDEGRIRVSIIYGK